MSEIEKMYELAGVNKKCTDKRYEKCTGVCYDCKYFIYPPFTADKQIELIKWLSNNDKDKNKKLTLYNSAHPYYYFGLEHGPAHREDDMWGYGESLGTTFEDGLAQLVNDLWQDLTKEERKQIRDILKGLE